VVADEEQFATEQAAAKEKQAAQSKIQNDINRERQKTADKKVCQDYIRFSRILNSNTDCPGTKTRMGLRETGCRYVVCSNI
jgi:hypothetical protein